MAHDPRQLLADKVASSAPVVSRPEKSRGRPVRQCEHIARKTSPDVVWVEVRELVSQPAFAKLELVGQSFRFSDLKMERPLRMVVTVFRIGVFGGFWAALATQANT